MTTYVIAVNTIHDSEALARYRPKAGEALGKHGGQIVAAGPLTHALEGAPEAKPDIAAILSFPSAEAAQAWIGDTELEAVHAERRASGDTRVWMLG